MKLSKLFIPCIEQKKQQQKYITIWLNIYITSYNRYYKYEFIKCYMETITIKYQLHHGVMNLSYCII